MDTLAAAACAWPARGDPGYGAKWRGRLGVARPIGAFSTGVCIDCRLSYTTVQARIAQSTIVACISYCMTNSILNSKQECV